MLRVRLLACVVLLGGADATGGGEMFAPGAPTTLRTWITNLPTT